MNNELRVIMAMKKMNISELSKHTELSRSTISDIYNEKSKNPDSMTLIKIAKALGVTLDELLGLKNY